MALNEFKDKRVSVITNDGRQIVGTLRGFDQTINIVLENAHERLFSLDRGMVQNDLGLYLIRGDNISLIGELDTEKDESRDLLNIKAEAIKPVRWE